MAFIWIEAIVVIFIIWVKYLNCMHEFTISTRRRTECIDITYKVEEIVSKSGIKEGICNIFVPHATAGIIINENADSNILDDFNEALTNIIPKGKWRHDKLDGNGDAHIKAGIIGPSQTLPVKNGKLLLGTWQAIMLCEFDGPRSERRIIVSCLKNN